MDKRSKRYLVTLLFLVVGLLTTWTVMGRDASTIWTSNYIFDAGDSGPQWATDFNDWATSLEAEWVTRSDNLTIQNSAPTHKWDTTSVGSSDWSLVNSSGDFQIKEHIAGTTTGTVLLMVGSADGAASPRVVIAANSVGASSIFGYEDTTNGTNYAQFIWPASMAANRAVTLPDASGTAIVAAINTPANGDTSPSVKGVQTLYFSNYVTSITTVLDLDDAVDGQVIHIRGDPEVNFADSSPFYLSAAWVPDSSWDTLTLVATDSGSNFFEISRSDNN